MDIDDVALNLNEPSAEEYANALLVTQRLIDNAREKLNTAYRLRDALTTKVRPWKNAYTFPHWGSVLADTEKEAVDVFKSHSGATVRSWQYALNGSLLEHDWNRNSLGQRLFHGSLYRLIVLVALLLTGCSFGVTVETDPIPNGFCQVDEDCAETDFCLVEWCDAECRPWARCAPLLLEGDICKQDSWCESGECSSEHRCTES